MHTSGTASPQIAWPAHREVLVRERVLERTTILLVEDDSALRESIGSHLRRIGHAVVAAGSGAEAMELAALSGPDVTLALIDVRLPDMDGFDLWQRLNRQVLGIRGLFMSGHDLADLPPIPLDRKEVRFLPKPFEVLQLTDLIQDLLANR
jgi:CheY-like chemotaxis protein